MATHVGVLRGGGQKEKRDPDEKTDTETERLKVARPFVSLRGGERGSTAKPLNKSNQ